MIDFSKMTDAQIDLAFALNRDTKKLAYDILRKAGANNDRASNTTDSDGTGVEDLRGAGADSEGDAGADNATDSPSPGAGNEVEYTTGEQLESSDVSVEEGE